MGELVVSFGCKVFHKTFEVRQLVREVRYRIVLWHHMITKKSQERCNKQMYCFLRKNSALRAALSHCPTSSRSGETDRCSQGYKTVSYYIHHTNQDKMWKYRLQGSFSQHVSMFILNLCMGFLTHQRVWHLVKKSFTKCYTKTAGGAWQSVLGDMWNTAFLWFFRTSDSSKNLLSAWETNVLFKKPTTVVENVLIVHMGSLLTQLFLTFVDP